MDDTIVIELRTLSAALSCFVKAIRRVENGLYDARERAVVRTNRQFWERRLVTVRRKLGLTDQPAERSSRELEELGRIIEDLWSDGLPNRRRDDLLLVRLGEMERHVMSMVQQAAEQSETVASLFGASEPGLAAAE